MKWHHGGFPSLKRGFDSRRPLVEDYGSSRALSGAALQLVGGILIGTAIWLGAMEGMRSPITIGLGGLAALYFVVSGSVHLVIGALTRRARR